MVEFASLQIVLLNIVVAMAAVMSLPIFVYLCVKLGTVGFYYGRDAFLKSKKNEESADGNAERQEEETG